MERKQFNLVRTLNKPASVATHCHAYQREVSVQANLSAGAYLVVPSTYLPGAEASFLLRVFSSAGLVLRWVRIRVEPKFDLVGVGRRLMTLCLARPPA